MGSRTGCTHLGLLAFQPHVKAQERDDAVDHCLGIAFQLHACMGGEGWKEWKESPWQVMIIAWGQLAPSQTTLHTPPTPPPQVAILPPHRPRPHMLPHARPCPHMRPPHAPLSPPSHLFIIDD